MSTFVMPLMGNVSVQCNCLAKNQSGKLKRPWQLFTAAWGGLNSPHTLFKWDPVFFSALKQSNFLYSSLCCRTQDGN